MATNENNTDSDPTNESSSQDDSSPDMPEKEEAGLTAEEAADKAYDGVEVWSKNRNLIFTIFGLVALAVAAFIYFNDQGKAENSERSSRFLAASNEAERAEELFLSFAEDYDDSLGGVASFRAAAIQYRDKRYVESAKNFKDAATKLHGDPLAGRALLGQAVSLIKSGGNGAGENGIAILREIAGNDSLLPSDRAEARFLLAVQALADDDENAFSSELEILAADVNASSFHTRLVELSKARKLLQTAQSLADLNLENGREFLANNKKRKEVVSLESGLQYEILKEGNGTSPLKDDEVEVHYHGTLLDGEVFDSSIERDEPAKFNVNGVIKGWTEALQIMKVGDKWKLFVPSGLAYAETGSNSIGPNETLTFEVELLGITPKPQALQILDSNASDSNSSFGEAPLIIQGTDGNASVPAPVIESNESVPTVPKQPVDGNGSE
jgi:FKBP-type peptidyl-prolyl cis-trans isomerase